MNSINSNSQHGGSDWADKEGFPASPFRTDSWPLPTEGYNYQKWIK